MPEFLDLDESPKDSGRHRTLEVEGGNKIHFKCSDPYGFWAVNWDKGAMPDELQGNYTSFEEAEKAVRAYLQAKKKTAALETTNAALEKAADEVVAEEGMFTPKSAPEPVPERPVLKLKPVKTSKAKAA